jgi:hypothetical protein
MPSMEPTTSRTEKVDPKCDLPLQMSNAGKVLPSKPEPSTLDSPTGENVTDFSRSSKMFHSSSLTSQEHLICLSLP